VRVYVFFFFRKSATHALIDYLTTRESRGARARAESGGVRRGFRAPWHAGVSIPYYTICIVLMRLHRALILLCVRLQLSVSNLLVLVIDL
jgi:hypothetical protein